MIDFPNDFDFSSSDALDLAAVTFGLESDAINPTEAKNDAPTINPLHNMDSLDFYLWMMDEVEKEHERRQAQNTED